MLSLVISSECKRREGVPRSKFRKFVIKVIGKKKEAHLNCENEFT